MVEDYLSDREQEEALRAWWRDNWRWILGGIALGVALLFGWFR
jgi:predicted negative regulator of RcsB-dependent stress response